MEAEAGLTLGVLEVVAKTPSVFGTHMGSAMSMMEALGSKELGGVMDFLFSMSLPTLSAQKLEISESESVEANMEAEAGLTLGVLAVVASPPSVFGTHMGSAMSMMEALGSNELGGVMDFLFSMSLPTLSA